MTRRTKVVATLGPASHDEATISLLIDAGLDVARIALAHGEVADHIACIELVRRLSREKGRTIGILIDLPGPKVRAVAFPPEGVVLETDATVVFVPGDADESPGTASSAERIIVEHATLLDEIEVGDVIALGDGAVGLRVTEVDAESATAKVVNGGRLQGRPGVNLPPARFSLTAPTAHDLALLDAVQGAGGGVDFVALSFVTSAKDIRILRQAVGPEGPMLVAKIETSAAVDDLEAIIACSDAVMVARGDLGVRFPPEDVPHLQKRIIRQCVAFGRPVITATQMLESMIQAPVPTRAEVSDVANAVFDGTDAVMLSAETAIGHHPVAAVATMARVAERAEREANYVQWGSRLGRQQNALMADATSNVRMTAAMTAAAWRAALDVDAAVIVCCTRTGSTARSVARFRPTAPIVAMSPSPRTAGQLSLTWGVDAFSCNEYANVDEIVWYAVEEVFQMGMVAKGDIVAVLAGSPDDPEPVTDVLRLVRVR
ncbi:MAG: pyruvate kinase [Acidimicrobiales bacterium]